MKETDVVVIGGGAAGLMAAAILAGKGIPVILMEKKTSFGRKLLLTGKGRCNITNMCGWDEFRKHVYPDAEFFKHSFQAFSNDNVCEFFHSIGVETKVERGNRVFPVSDSSATVLNGLLSYLRNKGVKCLTSVEVLSVTSVDSKFVVEAMESHGTNLSDRSMNAKSVIIATGGLSYPRTGSTGNGYLFAASLGHTVEQPLPSLTALMPERYDRRLVGMHLKNVTASLIVDGNTLAQELGEMDFTENGLDGAIILKISRKAVKAMTDGKQVSVSLDLKPGLTPDQLARRVSRDMFNSKTTVRQLLPGYMPSALILPFSESFPNIGVQDLPVKLKNWKFNIIEYVGFDRCVITAGGVSLKELSRKTMESKIHKGLFFAGEVMDLDGDTGGYNLQIAFSTAHAAAEGVLKYLGKNKK